MTTDLTLDPERAEHPHARRRPGLVAVVYAYRALAGVLVALPAAVAIGGPTAWWPRAQAELWKPGGVMLIESLRLSRRAWMPVLWSAGAVATVTLLAGVLPLGALLAGLGRRGRVSAAFVAGRAFGHAGTLALVFGLGLLAQGAVFALTVLLGSKLIETLKLVAPTQDLAFVALFAIALGLALVVGVVRDLAAAAAVRDELRFYDAASRALRCARKAGGRTLLAWSWRGLLGLAGLGAAAALASLLPNAPAMALLGGVALHQAGIAGTTFAHASWLAAAMRLLDATGPRAEAAEAPETPPSRVEETAATVDEEAAAAPEPATTAVDEGAPPAATEPATTAVPTQSKTAPP